jgi:hypothetical protein
MIKLETGQQKLHLILKIATTKLVLITIMMMVY